MRPMRYTRGVQRDHPTRDVLPAHKIAIHVIQYFVAVDIAVIIWRGYGVRVIIVEPRYKTADHEIMRLERLVNGRRLVYPPRDRFKIMYAEGVRITTAIPTDHIEGMMPIVYTVHASFLLCLYHEVTRL